MGATDSSTNAQLENLFLDHFNYGPILVLTRQMFIGVD